MSLDAGFTQSQSESRSSSASLAKEIVSKAVEKTLERVSHLRRLTVTEQIRELNRHELANPAGTDGEHVSGLYLWVEKLQRSSCVTTARGSWWSFIFQSQRYRCSKSVERPQGCRHFLHSMSPQIPFTRATICASRSDTRRTMSSRRRPSGSRRLWRGIRHRPKLSILDVAILLGCALGDLAGCCASFDDRRPPGGSRRCPFIDLAQRAGVDQPPQSIAQRLSWHVHWRRVSGSARFAASRKHSAPEKSAASLLGGHHARSAARHQWSALTALACSSRSSPSQPIQSPAIPGDGRARSLPAVLTLGPRFSGADHGFLVLLRRAT